MHLWFILYLLGYSALALPIFQYLHGPAGKRLVEGLAVFFTRRGTILLLALPLALASAVPIGDAPQKTDHVLEQIEKALSRLSEFHERGAYPKDLLALGIREYREIFFKSYRIIYRIMDKNVYVLLITDGRRDMQSLLQWRLFSA
jgi:toxin ParE1/3/4